MTRPPSPIRIAGHPLHPVLTDLPIGFWTSAWVLDLIGGARHAPSAQLLTGLGVLSVVPTAATGAADWRSLSSRDKRLGLVHAASNVTATALYTASWLARRRGDRRRGLVLGHLGAVAATVGGALGGELVFRRGAGVEIGDDEGGGGGGRSGVILELMSSNAGEGG